jgi:hypothetical protein
VIARLEAHADLASRAGVPGTLPGEDPLAAHALAVRERAVVALAGDPAGLDGAELAVVEPGQAGYAAYVSRTRLRLRVEPVDDPHAATGPGPRTRVVVELTRRFAEEELLPGAIGLLLVLAPAGLILGAGLSVGLTLLLGAFAVALGFAIAAATVAPPRAEPFVAGRLAQLVDDALRERVLHVDGPRLYRAPDGDGARLVLAAGAAPTGAGFERR